MTTGTYAGSWPQHQMRIPELLSPAGDLISVRAAVHNGADAIYLGARSFGARASKGFDDDALGDAIHYAHLYGRRVYVTVNTLIKPAEFSELTDLIHTLNDLNADAIIVQDLGLVRYARRHLPQLALHASTQMSVHNAWGAQWLRELGLTRVVAARECSLGTLRSMAATGLETEVFVHGALCVSQSGQCLLSAMIGGRSGNRGRCAQPCRMSYTMDGRSAAWLSPRDISLADHLGSLMDIGITSFKIEGRLKRPEYVAVVTDVYRRTIDHLKDPTQPPAPTEKDRQALLQIFNRGGFSSGYLQGPDDRTIMNPERVSHEGVKVSAVRSTQPMNDVFVTRVRIERDLNNGDHLQIRSDPDQEMIYAGPPVRAGDEASIRHYKPSNPDARVYRLTDAVQIASAQETIARKPPAIIVNMLLYVNAGTPAKLAVTARGINVDVEGAVADAARSRALDTETAMRSMAKTADSPFMLGEFRFVSPAPSFLPLSSLNAMRREGLTKLENALVCAHERQKAAPTVSLPAKTSLAMDKKQQLWARTSRLEDLPELLAAGADHVIYAPLSFEETRLIRDMPIVEKTAAVLSLPGQCSDRVLDHALPLAAQHQTNVMLDNVGQLPLPWPRQRFTGNGIPVWNPESLHLLFDMGIHMATLSSELSGDEIEQLAQHKPDGMGLLLPVYGRARVMTLNHCPARLRAGNNAAAVCRSCRSNDGHGAMLNDQFGFSYPLKPLRMPEGCINHLLFHTPLHLGQRAPRMSWLMDFTTETRQDALAVTRWYRALMDRHSLPELSIPEYLGRWAEGVM